MKNEVLKFYADWCQPCKRMALVVEEVFPEVTEIDIDTPEGLKLTATYGIRGIPALVYKGVVLIGEKSKAELEDWKKKNE